MIATPLVAHCGHMQTTTHPTRRTFRDISLGMKILSAGLAVTAAATVFGSSASASEFYANPTISPIQQCVDGVYVAQLGLYNFGATDSTTFTVTVSGVVEPAATSTHTVAAGGQEWLGFTVPEGQKGSIHVANADPDHPIDFLSEHTPDCVADATTQLSVICDDDGPGAANVRFEWVNTSYTSAHVSLLLADTVLLEDDIVVHEVDRYHEVPVAEGDHVIASIVVDGVTTSSIDRIVDCQPDTMIPDSTIPDTTPDSTIPDSVPDTKAPTVQSVVPAIDTPTTRPATPAVDLTDAVAQSPRPETVQLPATGSSSNTWILIFGSILLSAGLGLMRTARRVR